MSTGGNSTAFSTWSRQLLWTYRRQHLRVKSVLGLSLSSPPPKHTARTSAAMSGHPTSKYSSHLNREIKDIKGRL